MRAVVVVFQHQMNVPAGCRGEAADRAAEFVQNRDFAGLGDGVDRIEPQPVEPIIAQPVQRILDGEARTCGTR